MKTKTSNVGKEARRMGIIPNWPPPPLKIKDYPEKKIINIEGINYSYGFFESLGIEGLSVGSNFKIVKRENETITVERIE